MSEKSDRFRMRARQCRELAKIARDDLSRQTLEQMAHELDEAAAEIERDGTQGRSR